MADRYWVGGTGTWDTTSTTNWSATSGGAGGASVPTSVDSVFFDQAGTYTVTMTGTLNCLSITVSAGTVTFANGSSPILNVYGSMSLVAGTIWDATGPITFRATTAGQTITTNGVSFGAIITFNGSGGVWTLGSAFSTTNVITLSRGTLDTSASNYALTASAISVDSSTSAILTLNGSTVNLSSTGNAFVANTSSVINAGTSTINCTSTAGCGFSGSGKTYYNVSFTGAASFGVTITVSGANTFNSLSFTSPSANTVVSVTFAANQNITSSFTGSGSQANRRLFYRSDTIGTVRALTLGSAATISNADFRDITAVTNSITATTGGGNCGGNTNITFPAAKTVYWNLAGAQNWSATGWATSSGGTPAVANFPLAQDTAVFDNTGSVTGTITLEAPWNIGSLDMSGRTSPMTLSLNALVSVYGSWSNGSGTTFTGTQTLTFAGRSVQTVLGNGVTFPVSITMDGPGGTFFLGSAVTLLNTRTFILTRGTLGLSSYSLTTGLFASNNSNSRAIQFGTGSITVNGSGGTLWDTGTLTGMVVGGTPIVNVSYPFGAAVFVQPGSASEANSISFNFTAGTYSLTLVSGNVRNLNFTGFSGSLNNVARFIYGDLTLSPTMTLTTGTNNQTFASTSATPRSITSNGKIMDFPISFTGAGGTWVLQDALTVGSTRTTVLTRGTLDLNGKTLTTGLFSSSNSNVRSIAFGATGSITLTNNSGSAITFTTATATNFTSSGARVVNLSTTTGSGVTINTGNVNEANCLDFNITTGSFILTLTGPNFRSLDFTGFSGSVTVATRTLYGNLTLSSGMTLDSGTGIQTFASTSATPRTITTNGKTIPLPITFNGAGGTWQLQDALTLGSTRDVTFTNGTVDLNGKTLTTSAAGTATGTKNLTFNGGALVLSASSSTTYPVAFSNVAPTGFTTTAGTGTGTISLTSATAKTFAGAGSTFNCTINQGGAGALTITGSNTFANITNTVQPASVLFTAGTTTTFTSGFSLSGTAGNLITISSVTAAQHTLVDTSGTINVSYCNISYSNATGGATWNAFTSNGNVDGGNNTGWLFTGGAVQNSNFLQFFNGP